MTDPQPPHRSRPQQPGPQQWGPQQSGLAEPWAQQPGPQQPWAQQAGPQQPWAQQAEPQQTGPQQAGPQQAWAQQPGRPPGAAPTWGPTPTGLSWGGEQPGPGTGGRGQGGGGGTLLVLGLLGAVLTVLGSFLPSYSFPDDAGSTSPLVQRFGSDTQFQAAGLVLLGGGVLLAVGALRARTAVGVGLALVGTGIVLSQGLGLLLGLLQSAGSSGPGLALEVGGVLLVAAGLTAVAAAVLGLLSLARTDRAGRA